MKSSKRSSSAVSPSTSPKTRHSSPRRGSEGRLEPQPSAVHHLSVRGLRMPRNLLVSHYALPSPAGRIGIRPSYRVSKGWGHRNSIGGPLDRRSALLPNGIDPGGSGTRPIERRPVQRISPRRVRALFATYRVTVVNIGSVVACAESGSPRTRSPLFPLWDPPVTAIHDHCPRPAASSTPS